MLKKTIQILVLFIAINNYGQDIKFGKVSKEELQELQYAKDSSAAAAFLYKERKSYYNYYKGSGLQLITEVHERIKIYDKKGFEYATKSIDLYKSGSNDESISGIKGYTYNLIGNEIEDTKLSKESIFRSKYNKNIDQVKISMPNVREGSVVEYRYKIMSPFYQNIGEYELQAEIPIKQLEASLRILDYFKFNQIQKGFFLLKPKTERINNVTLDAQEMKITYELTNVPAMKQEKYVSNINNYRSGVKYEIVSLEIPGTVYEVIAKSWDDVVETIYKSPFFGKEIEKKNYYEDELDAVLVGSAGDKERALAVMDFVKKKVKWNSYRGYSMDEGVKKAYKEGTGNIADINLMLISMLQYAGLKAQPVILSTKDNGIPLFPTLQGFNYVVAAVKIADNYCLLDASDPFSTIDVLPMRTLNWFGRMVSASGTSEIVDLAPKRQSQELVIMQVDLSADGTIKGDLQQRYTDHYARNFRNNYNKGSQESFLQGLQQELSDLEITDYQVKNEQDAAQPLTQSYAFYKEDMLEMISGKLFFNPLFFFMINENPFKSDKREYPVDFGHPWEDSYIITITVPDGFKIESLPAPLALVLPENRGTFKYNIAQQGQAIVLKVNVGFNSAIVPSQEYGMLKEFYRQLVEKETEKVVLSKI